jgi:hypothetical protein
VFDAAAGSTFSVSRERGGNVIALAETGFACVTLAQVRDTGVIVLQPFGRIEGTLKIGGQPAAGRYLQLTVHNPCVMMPLDGFKVETDAEGKFQIEKVPAGQGQLDRIIRVGEFGWSHNYGTSVNVEAGRTTTIYLGDNGGVIRGRARVQNPPVDQPLSISGNLESKFPAPPPGGSPAELRARMTQSRGFPVSVNPDGSFLVDSVPAGDYNLSLRAAPPYDSSFGPPTGPNISQTVTVTVPDNPDPGSPIDVGEVILQEIKPKP